MADLPLFGHAAPGHRSLAAYADLRRHAETVLEWRGKGCHMIEIAVARDPLGEWWASYGWGISADVASGPVGHYSPLSILGPDRRGAIAKAAQALAASLPSYRGAAGSQVARLRAALAPITVEAAHG